MNESPESGASRVELEELTLLLENRTFVDYFNIFLCLPVFGQHVIYNYMEREFYFEPPIKSKRHFYVDCKEVLKWLCTERLRLFKKSPLYTEYRLSLLLRDASFDKLGFKLEQGQDPSVFNRNVIGSVRGMMLFREDLRGTQGENVYRCWRDIEEWRQEADPERKMYLKHLIKTHYINENSTTEVSSTLKGHVFRGKLDLDLVPDSDIHQRILDSVVDNRFYPFMESDEVLLNLQTMQLHALRKYWLPRHLLHVINTLDKKSLEVLMKPAPGDVEYIGNERRLRCRYMFPTVFQNGDNQSSVTTVIVSKSEGDLKTASIASALSSLESYNLEEDGVEPTDLFELWTGPAKDIEFESVCTSTLISSPSLPEMSTADEGDRKLRSISGNTSNGSPIRSPIPIILTTYLGGKKRASFGFIPKTKNTFVWSLASDILANWPFRIFLKEYGQDLELNYLEFWIDVRNYLDTDEHSMNTNGQPVRLTLAHRIADAYLSTDGKRSYIFPEKLKMSLFTAISTNDDWSLLSLALDIAQDKLSRPLKLYVLNERHDFLKQVQCQKPQKNMEQSQTIEQATTSMGSRFSRDANDDSMYMFNCVTLDEDSVTSSLRAPTETSSDSAISRPTTSYRVSITYEQMLKAMELTVLSREYGVSMVMPQTHTSPSQLVESVYSEYGSLHLSRVPTVRNERLRNVIEPPKINIKTIKVSRKVILEEIDISTLRTEDMMPKVPVRGRVARRSGLIMERPNKPKSLIEILTVPIQFDFFKRFMLVHKMTLPLLFWRAVEDLQDISNGRARQTKVIQIMRKFFGKYAKYGASLDCDEEIISQIPNMEKVTPGILMCAQAAVYRALERKWFPQYIDTFPPDSKGSTPDNMISFSIKTGLVKHFETAADLVNKAKKVKKRSLGNRRTLAIWKNLTKALSTFVKAINCKTESQLFEMYLKYQVEREKQTPQLANNMPEAEKNAMMASAAANVQTRVVVCNRLIIMNRLPSDLRFWTEVRKYQGLYDSAAQKSFISDQETEFLTDKAKSIISCFIASDIQPRVQVNIPNEMSLNIVNSIAAGGPKRGTFHDAIMQLFPILHHFYRKFSNEWMKGNIPDEYFDSIEMSLHDHVASTPHQELTIPDFTNIQVGDIKTITQVSYDENLMRIHFSIAEGVSLIFPKSLLHKTPTLTGKRTTKQSVHALNEVTIATKESKIRGGHGDKKDSRLSLKSAADKHSKHMGSGKKSSGSLKERKLSTKIIVKESEQCPVEVAKGRRGSNDDRTRRLSFLVETLNKEKEQKIKEQNRLFSKLMCFDDVVQAALAELPESNSALSLIKESPKSPRSPRSPRSQQS